MFLKVPILDLVRAARAHATRMVSLSEYSDCVRSVSMHNAAYGKGAPYLYVKIRCSLALGDGAPPQGHWRQIQSIHHFLSAVNDVRLII